MSNSPLNGFVTLEEALDRIGRHLFPDEWTNLELSLPNSWDQVLRDGTDLMHHWTRARGLLPELKARAPKGESPALRGSPRLKRKEDDLWAATTRILVEAQDYLATPEPQRGLITPPPWSEADLEALEAEWREYQELRACAWRRREEAREELRRRLFGTPPEFTDALPAIDRDSGVLLPQGQWFKADMQRRIDSGRVWVLEARLPKPAPKTAPPNTATEGKFGRWLQGEVAAWEGSDDEPIPLRGDVLAKARVLFPNLGVQAFRRQWAAHAPAAWRQAGRRPRSARQS